MDRRLRRPSSICPMDSTASSLSTCIFIRPRGSAASFTIRTGRRCRTGRIALAIEQGDSLTPLITTNTDNDRHFTLKGIVQPNDDTKLVIEVLPSFDRREHLNTTIGIRSIPASVTAEDKLGGYNFMVDLSRPQI